MLEKNKKKRKERNKKKKRFILDYKNNFIFPLVNKKKHT